MTDDDDDDESAALVLLPNGDFDYDSLGLRIVGVHHVRTPGAASNSDALEVTITQDGNEPHVQKIYLRGGSLEIPSFYEFITQFAARLALERKCTR